MSDPGEPLLRLRNLSVTFETSAGPVHAVQGVDLDLKTGETLGLVGESGCGKSTLGRAVLALLPENAKARGSVEFGGKDLLALPSKELRQIRGRNLSMIFQDPMTRFDPLMRIRDHFVETLRAHDPEISKEDAVQRARRVLASVRVPPDRMDRYPHELSGGMRQRAMIALALLFNPTLLVADEPTTALDVILEAQILRLLQSIKDEYKMGVLLITHNLGLVAQFADRVAVMYAGHIIEESETRALFRKPLHPYTQGLLRSVIDIETQDLYSIPGDPPSLLGELMGCPFYDRCGERMEICKTVYPTPRPGESAGSNVACHLYEGSS